MLFITCKTLQFYRSIGKVILKIHLILDEYLKFTQVKRILYRVYKLLHAHYFFCVFVMNLINEFHKRRYNSCHLWLRYRSHATGIGELDV